MPGLRAVLHGADDAVALADYARSGGSAAGAAAATTAVLQARA